jgi:hypothetical protein
MRMTEQSIFKPFRDKIRGYMNDIADHMAGGGCADHEEYIRLVGKVEALALLERDLIDYEERFMQE